MKAFPSLDLFYAFPSRRLSVLTQLVSTLGMNHS